MPFDEEHVKRMEVEFAAMKTRLDALDQREATPTPEAKDPNIKISAALMLPHGSPEVEKEFNYWKSNLELITDDITGERHDRRRFNYLLPTLSPDVQYSIQEAVTQKSFSACMSALERLYIRKAGDVAAKSALLEKKQEHGENVDSFVSGLRTLASKCTFAVRNTVDGVRSDWIRVAFVRGIKDPEIKYRLLQEPADKELVDLVDLARDLERHRLESGHKGPEPFMTVNQREPGVLQSFPRMKRSTEPLNPDHVSCKCCRKRHSKSMEDCPAPEYRCWRCMKRGHFRKYCPAANPAVTQSSGKGKLNLMTPMFYKLGHTTSRIRVLMKGSKWPCLVDTGASRNFISGAMAWKIKADFTPTVYEVELANGSMEKILWMCRESMVLADSLVMYPELEFMILEDLGTPVVLGNEFLELHRKVVFDYGGPLETLCLNNKNGSDYFSV